MSLSNERYFTNQLPTVSQPTLNIKQLSETRMIVAPNDTVKAHRMSSRRAGMGLKRQIPTQVKVQYLRALIGAGFKHIDAVSFVSPKAVPQMADSEEVLAATRSPPDDVEIIGIVVNRKARTAPSPPGPSRTLGYPLLHLREPFLRKNQNQSPEENYEVLETIKKRAEAAGLRYGGLHLNGIRQSIRRSVERGQTGANGRQTSPASRSARSRWRIRSASLRRS